ncbi:MAG TPA: hypothetical protein VD927_09145 [Chryseosolibacter sp.]|nr:hypothetical protein [Chryseosolibacter sp.]
MVERKKKKRGNKQKLQIRAASVSTPSLFVLNDAPDDESFPGILPQRDLKKNLGCG